MIVAILQAIFGTLFALFIPGWLITQIFFKDLKLIEKIGFAVVFSIMIDIAIGISLGYNEAVKNITGGVTTYNIWFWELTVTGLLFVIYLFKLKNEASKKISKK